ncbi:MAG: PAS domain S-box protein [Acidobacteria bacterium]|nr:PAS domain S-box protein [Acidobacteriota bacterium]
MLHAVGELTAVQVAEWRTRLAHDVAGASRADVTRRAIDRALATPAAAGRADDLVALLTFFRTVHDYDAAMVITTDGRALAVAGDELPRADSAHPQVLADARQSEGGVLSPMFRGPLGHVDIDAAAAIRDAGGDVRAFLVSRTNASATLDPVIQLRPTASPSTETMLVMADGDDVLFLNDLRHRQGAALALRHQMSETGLPAVAAVSGQKGEFRGRDYRGVPVLADLRPVGGTPWFLVSKVDMAEILDDARERAVTIAVIAALLIGLLIALAAYLNRQAHAVVFRDLWEAERMVHEAEERFRAALYSIGDAVVTTDTTGAVREMNRVAERLTGWTEAEARGCAIEAVFRIVNEQSREPVSSPVDAVLRDGTVVALANHTILLARDGAEVPIADSAAPIRDRDGQVTGVVLVFSDQTASHAARHRIEESEERLRLALRAANQGTYDLNVQTGEATVSPEYATMLGYEPSSFRETNAAWIGRLHPDDRTPVAQAYRDYVEGRLPEYRVEFRQRTADGGWQWILSLGRIVARTADGQPLRMLGTHTDISELKDAEQRIRRLSQLYATLSQCNQAIVRSTSEAELFPQLCRDAVQHGGMAMAWIGIVDVATGRVVAVARHGDTTGYLDDIQVSVDPGSPFGQGPTGRAIRAGRSAYCQDFQAEAAMGPWRDRAIRAGYAASAALPLARDGTVIGALMLYVGVPGFFDAEGQTLLNEMATDISFALGSFAREEARQRAQADADAARRQLEATIAAVPDLMFEVDLDGRFHACHTSRADALLAPPGTFLGRTVGDVMPPDVVATVMEAIAEAGRTGHSVGATYHLDLPQGRLWFELSVARHSQAPDEPTRLLVLARDVTARKHAEQQRDHLEAQLRQAQKMEAIGQLAGGIAHDFNNLLTIINGRSDLVLRTLEPGQGLHEDILDIRQAGERAAALTRQLLTFSRREVDVAPAVVPVKAGVGAMQNMLRRLISEDIQLRVSTADDTGAVRIAPGQLEQLVLNLVLNASDAMPDGGQLSIDLGSVVLSAGSAAAFVPPLAPGRFVRIAVSDTGLGMDEAVRARAFEPFFTTKGLGKGTGLGLSTVYGIVRQAGGAVTLRSAPGQGSTFEIFLPHVEGEPRPVVLSAAVARGHETVLIVDDERALVSIASRILTSAGYTVLTAADGREALDLMTARGGQIDLLLTDVVIPGISGRELAERVRALYPAVRVLFSSGYTDDDVLRRGVEASRVHFIAKPYSVADLTNKVRDVLSSPAS